VAALPLGSASGPSGWTGNGNHLTNGGLGVISLSQACPIILLDLCKNVMFSNVLVRLSKMQMSK